MAGVAPASRGPAQDRHCRASPRSCAPLSPPVAEHSRATGLTGLPPNPACISPTARQVSTTLARVVRVPQPWGLGDGPSSGPPTEEAHVREKYLSFAAPEAPLGTIVSRRVPEDSPVLAALLPACPRSLSSSLDEQAGAPITSSQQQGPSSGSSLSSIQTCSSAVLLPERTVPKQCTCRQPQPSGISGHEVGRPPPHCGPGCHRGPYVDRGEHPPGRAWQWLSSHPAALRQPRELSDRRARPVGHSCCSCSEPRARKYKCGLPQPCPEEHLAFRMVSGAANVIGPKICLEDKMLMSSVKDNVGRGLNIALVNGVSGELIEARAFDMWAGDVNDLLKFIRPLHEGTLVFVASYDDPATKMNEETRKLFSDLGSKNVKDLAFRDSWVFVGAKGVQNKSPFEQHVKNSKHTNKYEGWPEALEMEGCIPRRTTAR